MHIVQQVFKSSTCALSYPPFFRFEHFLRLRFIVFDYKATSSDAGTAAGGAVKELRAMQTYKTQKHRYEYSCLCSATIWTSKIIPEIVENRSEVPGCANSGNEFVSIRS